MRRKNLTRNDVGSLSAYDNSPVERFFSSLKREWIGDQLYHSRSEAIADIREYLMCITIQ